MRKDIIQKIIDKNPDALLVANKYKVLAGVIKRMYPVNYEKIPPAVWEDIAYHIVNGDRDWRKLSEGKKDSENKVILSQQWVVDNYMKL